MNKKQFLSSILKPALAFFLMMSSPIAVYAEGNGTESNEPNVTETEQPAAAEAGEAAVSETQTPTDETTIESGSEGADETEPAAETTPDTTDVSSEDTTNENATGEESTGTEEPETEESQEPAQETVTEGTAAPEPEGETAVLPENTPEESKEATTVTPDTEAVAETEKPAAETEETEPVEEAPAEENVTDELEESEEETGSINLASYNGFTYESSNLGITITGYNGSSTSVSIPEQIGGKDVISIGASAFRSTNITELIIPAKVTTIGYNAFRDCRSLKKLIINAPWLQDLGTNDKVFYNSGADSGLEVIFSDGVKRIPQYLFYTYDNESKQVYCRINKVTIPSSVNEIGRSAFQNCYMLRNVTMNGAGEIGDVAFSNTNIENLVIPANTVSIGGSAFRDCRNLKKLTINAAQLLDLGTNDKPFYNSGADSGFEVIFSDGVTRIPAYLFYTYGSESKQVYCRINKVTIPSSVKQIGQGAFYNCYKLKNVSYKSSPSSWNAIKMGTSNEPLTNATIHYSVTNVDMYRMYNPNSGEHFYTGNTAERDHLISLGWNYEGIGFKAPVSSKTPMYRLYNPNAGDHHYTSNVAEKNHLVSVGWNYEGIGWYADDKKEIPQYRLYNPNATGAGSHHYTSNIAERNHLISLGWKDEGIGFYTCR